MSAEIIFTDEFEIWWDDLFESEQESVRGSVDLLEKIGAQRGYPHSSSIHQSKKLRELGIQHRGQPYRVLYAFDPARNAVLLLGGNKTGNDRWYEQNIPLAERIFADYLKETRQ